MRIAGIRDVDLFREHGIAQSTFSRWRGGSMPRSATLNGLADALGVRREWLSTGRGDMADSRVREPEPNAKYGFLADTLLDAMPAQQIEDLITKSTASLTEKARHGTRPSTEEISTLQTLIEALADKARPK